MAHAQYRMKAMQHYQFKTIRLDKLNIPVETLRQSSNAATDKKLKESLKEHGVLVPLVITELGRGEYAVWDGTRRIRNLRELGYPGSTELPALLTKGDDDQAVVAQVNINQTRERLSDLAEAEGLRQLVKDHSWKQGKAAKFLLKSESWASQILRVYKLPKAMLNSLRAGKIALSHAIVISKYIDMPKIMKMLYEEAQKGNISQPRLAALGRRAEQDGISKARKYRPHRYKFGEKSWIRIEPLQKGIRAEVHLDQNDDRKAAVKSLEKLLKDL